jgi:hypothetical protein
MYVIGEFMSILFSLKFLPKDLNEVTRELVTWKRFRDFKELYNYMFDYHTSLHRKDTFPEFARPKFFGRFDDKVIEERKECSLRLLQFIGTQGHLYRHEKFIEFLSVSCCSNSNKIYSAAKFTIFHVNSREFTKFHTNSRNSQISTLLFFYRFLPV